MFESFALHYAIVVLFVVLTTCAAVIDVVTYRIPNVYPAAVAVLYAAYAVAAPGAVGWGAAVAIAAAVFAGGAILFALGLMGGGDVKLLSAVALWAGPAGIIEMMAVVAVAGGVIAVIAASPLKHGVALAFDAAGRTAARDALLAGAIPYGVAIAAGGAFTGAALLAGWSA